MTRVLVTEAMGSVPDISVGCRINGDAKMLVHIDAASS
jgi:hypothetical protein